VSQQSKRVNIAEFTSEAYRREKEQTMRIRKRKELGQYIVADPEICHGQLTFKGTRILVSDVLVGNEGRC
jgi:hypothetical protein